MSDAAPPASLLREGDAMLRAVASDFCAIDGAVVVTTRDARAPSWPNPPCGLQVVEVDSQATESAAFDRLAREADATLVIAPEIGGALIERVRHVERLGGQLLGADSALAALASDKLECGSQLAARGIAVPGGALASEAGPEGPSSGFPVVVKPRDGAGSLGVRRIACLREWLELRPWRQAGLIVEPWRPGTSASVAAIAGPSAVHVLPPCGQTLSDDGRLCYLGGTLPLPVALAKRASALARKTFAALTAPRGYLGIDIVLGTAADGSEDCVIEVNPRLTTSYVGLRAAARGNIAEWMLAALSGEPLEMAFSDEVLEFTPAGDVRRAAAERNTLAPCSTR